MDSSDQIQIRISEIHDLSVFLGKDLKKAFLTSGFSKKKSGTQQMCKEVVNDPFSDLPLFR